jgi:hypothetical protein
MPSPIRRRRLSRVAAAVKPRVFSDSEKATARIQAIPATKSLQL